MKIAHVDHIRCDETAATTYVVVPSELTEEEFQTAVTKAQSAYEDVMAQVPLYSREYVPFPGLAQLRAMPADKTVKEVIDEYERQKEERKALDEMAERKRRSFGWYLEQQGLQIVQRAPAELKAKVNWGHRHGQNIRYDGIDVAYWYDDEDEGNQVCEPKEG